MNARTDLATLDAPEASAELNTSTAALVLDSENMLRLVSIAEMMAGGRATVPKHLHGNKGDCLAVAMQAMQWKMNPFAVAQKTHLVNGTLGYEAQLVIAVINTSGAIIGRLEWEWFGPWEKIVGKFKTVESKTKKDDDGHPKRYIVPAWDQKDEDGLGVNVSATLRGESAPRVLTLLMTQARTRNSTLWTEDPKQQLAYLASKRWGRLYTPEVILGVYTPDELAESAGPKDMGTADLVGEPKVLTPEQVSAWRTEAEKGTAAARKHWAAMGQPLRALASEAQKREMWALAEKADEARTVDAPPSKPAAAPAPAPAEQQAATEGTDPWVAEMQREEAAAAAAAAGGAEQ